MTIPLPPFDPMGLGLPSPWLYALAYLTLTLHLVAMHFTLGAAILLLLSWRRQQGVARFLGSGLPLGYSYLVTFGIPPLLFLQVIYGQFFYSSSVLIGAYWISVIPLIILGYGCAYWHRMTRDAKPRFQLVLLAVTTLVLLGVGYIYVNNITLSLRPERWITHYQSYPGGGALNLGEPTLHARYALFVVPGLFAAGLALVVRAGYLRKREARKDADVSHRWGMRTMVFATILECGAVAWVWVTLPPVIKEAFSRSGPLGSLTVAAAVLGLAALALARLSVTHQGTWLPVLALHLYVGAVACLVVTRDLVRQIYLQPYFDVAKIPVFPQWAMASGFVLTLIVGLGFLLIVTKQSLGGVVVGSGDRK